MFKALFFIFVFYMVAGDTFNNQKQRGRVLKLWKQNDSLTYTQFFRFDSLNFRKFGKDIDYSKNYELRKQFIDTLKIEADDTAGIKLIEINDHLYIIEQSHNSGSCGLGYDIYQRGGSWFATPTDKIGDECGYFEGVGFQEESYSNPDLYFSIREYESINDEFKNESFPIGFAGICYKYSELKSKYIRSYVYEMNSGPIPMELYGKIYDKVIKRE